MLGLLSIAILFTIYGICAVAITLRAIEAQEKALDEQPYGDCAFVHPELRGKRTDSREGLRGGGKHSSRPSGTIDARTHRRGVE